MQRVILVASMLSLFVLGTVSCSKCNQQPAEEAPAAEEAAPAPEAAPAAPEAAPAAAPAAAGEDAEEAAE